ncbi:hypothetical protein [Candidatus Nitrosocosmicus sp. FF01]|uniref:hypothetical protein n=1 Tax=Candidatus Nitrosocosmicus sp. FF01 TaxID=3397670 RepID=UPI0039EA2345
MSLDSLHKSHEVNPNKKEGSVLLVEEEQSTKDIEGSFRQRYSQELRSKRQQIHDNDRGFHELDDERRSVQQQMMRTPGRRGEIIKEEEISIEFGRRFNEYCKVIRRSFFTPSRS